MASSSVTALSAALGAPPAQLLARENALVWKALVVPAFQGARVLGLVQGSDKAPEEEIEAPDPNVFGKTIKIENPDYANWISRDQLVLRYILNVVSPDILSHVIGLDTSAKVWTALETLTTFQSRSRTQ